MNKSEFVKNCLENRREDRAVMANLRRGLGKKPGTAIEMLPYICPYLGEKKAANDAKFIIASLFAWHPEPTNKGNMGDHFRRIKMAFNDSDSIELRFQALLNAHDDSLPYHLRQAVSLAKAKDIPINYHQLYDDIIRWGHQDKYIQQRWANSFWAYQADTEENQNSNEQGE
ncbi:MAG: type I-E CRISPR-associated protein Cse2/CasB [candidate division Zixibacteria bacterium]|nr:type I-E CRISPR-associated protein Cse2/CasB [candidate division Zixibacteria bacterium]